MENYNVKQSWEELPYDYHMMNNNLAHFLRNQKDYSRTKKSFFQDATRLDNYGTYNGAPIFVQSLVSPHVNGRAKRKMLTNNGKKRVKVGSKLLILMLFHSYLCLAIIYQCLRCLPAYPYEICIGIIL